MRRSGWLSAVAFVLLIASSATAAAQSESPAGSPGSTAGPTAVGDLTVDVPAGAAPSGTTISVLEHAPADRPDELASVPMQLSYHEIQPSDVVFSAPVTVTRSIPFGELDIASYDPEFDGLIAALLLTRAGDGTWSWLGNGQVQLDAANDGFTVTATTDHGGPIVVEIPGSLVVANEDSSSTAVGQSFRVEGQLRVDPKSFGTVADVTGTTSDESIAVAGSSYDVPSFDRAKGLEFKCLAPGTVDYTASFAITDIGDVSPVAAAVGLPGTDIAVTTSGVHTCQ